MHPKDADGMANSVDPDQTASSKFYCWPSQGDSSVFFLFFFCGFKCGLWLFIALLLRYKKENG